MRRGQYLVLAGAAVGIMVGTIANASSSSAAMSPAYGQTARTTCPVKLQKVVPTVTGTRLHATSDVSMQRRGQERTLTKEEVRSVSLTKSVERALSLAGSYQTGVTAGIKLVDFSAGVTAEIIASRAWQNGKTYTSEFHESDSHTWSWRTGLKGPVWIVRAVPVRVISEIKIYLWRDGKTPGCPAMSLLPRTIKTNLRVPENYSMWVERSKPIVIRNNLILP